MIKITYEAYRNDYDRKKGLTKKFGSLDILSDWIFEQTTYDYSSPKYKYGLGFWMIEAFDKREFREDELPCRFEIKTEYPNNVQYWIHLMEKDDKIIFSDGTLTGRKFWSEEVKAWMRENWSRQRHPNFRYDTENIVENTKEGTYVDIRRLQDLRTELDHILNLAPVEDDCGNKQNKMYSDMANLINSITDVIDN